MDYAAGGWIKAIRLVLEEGRTRPCGNGDLL